MVLRRSKSEHYNRIEVQDIVIEAILIFMKQNSWSVTNALLKQMASMSSPDAEGKLFDKIVACRYKRGLNDPLGCGSLELR